MTEYDKDLRKVENRVKGTRGEILAVEFLKRKGYKILKTNFTTKIGEIDIIAKDKNYIVFVEVKSRETLAFGRPSEAVDAHKQYQIRGTAQMYLMFTHQNDANCRFDVLEVVGDKINHIENAF